MFVQYVEGSGPSSAPHTVQTSVAFIRVPGCTAIRFLIPAHLSAAGRSLTSPSSHWLPSPSTSTTCPPCLQICYGGQTAGGQTAGAMGSFRRRAIVADIFSQDLNVTACPLLSYHFCLYTYPLMGILRFFQFEAVVNNACVRSWEMIPWVKILAVMPGHLSPIPGSTREVILISCSLTSTLHLVCASACKRECTHTQCNLEVVFFFNQPS